MAISLYSLVLGIGTCTNQVPTGSEMALKHIHPIPKIEPVETFSTAISGLNFSMKRATAKFEGDSNGQTFFSDQKR